MATKDEDKEKKEKIFSESKESDNQQQKESIMTPQEKQTEEEEKKTIDSKSQTWGHSSTRPSNVWDYYNLYKSPVRSNQMFLVQQISLLDNVFVVNTRFPGRVLLWKI
jgi:AAA15 family ATPase/GTPase